MSDVECWIGRSYMPDSGYDPVLGTMKSYRSGRLKSTAVALVVVLVLVVGVAVAMYIIQVYQAPITEITTPRTTETTTPMTTTPPTVITTETVPPVTLVWEKTHGGGEDDRAESIIESGDGHYIVAGWTKSFGAEGWDTYFLKIDRDGNKIWEKTWGGEGDDVADWIVRSGDEGFIVVGWTTSLGAGHRDVYLLKIDGNGDMVWEKAYGGYGGDGAFSIVEAGDGGFIAAGITTSFGEGMASAYLLKVDGNGNSVWEKTYGGSGDDVANWIVESGDGGFVAAGWTTSLGARGEDLYVWKIDGDGNKVWEKLYGGNEGDWASCIVRSGDGGFVIGGGTHSFGAGSEDIYLLKIDGDGNKIWEKTYGGDDYDKTERVIQSLDGGFIITGVTNSSTTGDLDAYLLKIDADGNKVWEKTYGGSQDDEPWQILETEDGEFIVVGWTESFGAGKMDAYILKIRDNT